MKSILYLAQLLKPDYLPKPSNSLSDIVNLVFAIIGAIGVLMVTWAGVQLILSSGNPEKVATARRNIIYVVVGLIVASFAWTIVRFVIERAK